MKREPVYESDIAEINMTPFVDIVLVILVIFMVTATFSFNNIQNKQRGRSDDASFKGGGMF